MPKLPTITKKSWMHYLTRPENLLFASLWKLWYGSKQIESMIGVSFKNLLGIEERRHVLRSYFTKEEHALYGHTIERMLVEHPHQARLLMKDAFHINEMAQKKLRKGVQTFTHLSDAFDFLEIVTLYTTILPRQILEVSEKKGLRMGTAAKNAIQLRSTTLYPRILADIVHPMAVDVLRANRVTQKGAIDLITHGELLAGRVDVIPQRIQERKEKKTYIYENCGGKETVQWVGDSRPLIASIEGNFATPSDTIKGVVAFPGKVIGIARIILTSDGKDMIFNKGDILVSIHSTPNLMPLIKKAGALVTDEGGISCHAAIVSRELKIPCVMATKRATSLFHDGDTIEVDATAGVVRVLKSIKK